MSAVQGGTWTGGAGSEHLADYPYPGGTGLT